MHPEYQGLLEDVLGRPDDDTPRLVLADWLEENGQPERAVFIRIQCGRIYNAWGPQFCECCAMPVDSRGWTLLHRNGARSVFLTLPDYFTEPVPNDCSVWWRRGFVERVRLPSAVWEEHVSRLAQEHPLQRVELNDKKPQRTTGVKWAWTVGEGDNVPRWALPESITDYFPRPRPDFWEWPTEEAALDALSAACLALAKQHSEAAA